MTGIDREELSKEDEVRCSICLEDFVAGFALTRLPCAHRYHGEVSILFVLIYEVAY